MIKSDSAERWTKRHFDVGKTLEAGIKLTGAEVKSVRENRVDWRGGFVRVRNGQALIHNLKIFRYSKDGRVETGSERDRVLLLKKQEINQLAGYLSQKGTTIVPLKVYSNGPYIKVLLTITKGKKQYDHRETLKKKQLEMDTARELTGV